MSEKIFDDLMDVVGGEGKVTYVCFIMDHSGSMVGKAEVSKNNFNEQLETLKNETGEMETLVTLVEFSDRYIVPVAIQRVQNVKPLKTYWCDGTTALYDSIAAGIAKVQVEMDKDKRKDKAALVLIQTDGYENNSKEFVGEEGRKKIKELISGLEETGLWTFVFLGENIDKSVAMGMSFAAGNTINFADYNVANAETVQGLSGYYNGRMSGMTQTANFYNNTTADAKDIKQEFTTADAKDIKQELKTGSVYKCQ